MKKMYVIVAAVLVSTFAFAKEPGEGSSRSGLAVVKKNETMFNLYYQHAGVSNVRVAIIDAKGNEIQSDLIKRTNGFMRPYNFERMGEGEYTIMVEDGSGETLTKSFYLGTIDQPKAASILQLTDNKYLLAVKGGLYQGQVNVKIYDGATLIHEQSNEVTGDFGQIFNLKNADRSVSFEVTDSKGNRIN